jgi:dTDP-4-dehydrorhamnose 3,5-epimerase
MKITPCSLEGLLLIEPNVFGDNRGVFLESWNRRRYRDAGIALA